MQGRRRQGKRCLNNEFAVFQSSSRRIPTRLLCGLSWNGVPKSLIQVQKDKSKFCGCLIVYALHKT